ncbi:MULTISPECIES: serine protease [unclassified Stenotrophomonas]|uniref:trypsin-like peptidase domain-containing protein n=1 Tax=unclassified Stenotrophomonas TaxID=196198 RepID=UPI0013101075|nr:MULTISPECIES: serine protease [unclassified Stenotrophomonas]MDG9842460.1 serine protease [Stenotrophomonas sp. GD04054]MDH0016680.1 serine protease [Stenotrophomonas sp. GD04028]MDH0575180.1 serine protease [Stenotrophomonas sp. GD03997]MDH0861026.1 serine protease [Stenotrophomonas sp. GD03882]
MSGTFAPKTFDAFRTHAPRFPYGQGAKHGTLFPIDDPFGLRRAVVPVFQRDVDGSIRGAGTAFHVDGWGRLLTADHVVDCVRARHLRQIKPDARISADITKSPHSTVLLGYGVAFGTVGIPEPCWAPIQRVDAIVAQKRANPLSELQGDAGFQVGPDIAGVSILLDADAPSFHTVAVNFGYRPNVGEMVFAVGYPELHFEAMSGDEIARYLREGMFGVYGTVTDLFPDGRGAAHPSPVFEVEADWPSGMSGGPVFNRFGEVIGIVSSSWEPSDGAPGLGYATCLAMVPEAPQLAPTLDDTNPGRRWGFCVYNSETFQLADVASSQGHAEALLAQLPPGHLVRWGSHLMGGYDFMTGDAE